MVQYFGQSIAWSAKTSKIEIFLSLQHFAYFLWNVFRNSPASGPPCSTPEAIPLFELDSLEKNFCGHYWLYFLAYTICTSNSIGRIILASSVYLNNISMHIIGRIVVEPRDNFSFNWKFRAERLYTQGRQNWGKTF